MLSSITPLGERGRNNRWWLTVVAYIAGSAVGGATIGAVFGALGTLLPRSPKAALGALAVAALLGLLAELGVGGLRLPTNHRQVNERWLDTYRGWVYGVGFGFQLGLGVATIVTSAATYLTIAAALLVHSVAGGLAIGATFGLGRALPVLLTATARHPAGLQHLHRRTERWHGPAQRLSLGAQLLALLVSLVAMLVIP
jgi:hypothetical protein